eukprot:6491394-Amphidinium_carterae.2
MDQQAKVEIGARGHAQELVTDANEEQLRTDPAPGEPDVADGDPEDRKRIRAAMEQGVCLADPVVVLLCFASIEGGLHIYNMYGYSMDQRTSRLLRRTGSFGLRSWARCTALLCRGQSVVSVPPPLCYVELMTARWAGKSTGFLSKGFNASLRTRGGYGL